MSNALGCTVEVGVADCREVELLAEAMLSCEVELLAEEGAELILLEAGEGGGGRPACGAETIGHSRSLTNYINHTSSLIIL